MMKSLRSVLGIVALAVLSAGVLRAQDLTGTWQGVLQAGGRELRTVIRITKEDAGGLRAVFYSIDQGGQGIAGSSTVDGSTVRMQFGCRISCVSRLSGLRSLRRPTEKSGS